MARQRSAAEINKFVGGLITEASPLTFPDNATVDEDNFVLNRDGSRSRRQGLDFEPGAGYVSTTQVLPTTGDMAFSHHKWSNAGGLAEKTFVVVQVGQNLNFFDGASVPLSAGLSWTYTYPQDLINQRFQYAVVDGMLVVVNGKKEVDVYKYDIPMDTIIRNSMTLYVRDLFGLEDIAAS